MRKYGDLLLAIMLCIVFISCEDTGLDYYSSRSSSSSGHPRGFPALPPAPTTQPAVFPNTIGSQWKYAINGVTKSIFGDTIGVIIDTLDISVADSVRFSDGQPAMVWHYHYLHKEEIHYIVTIGDTVLFTTSSGTAPPSYYDTVFSFPLYEGKTWTTEYGHGDFSVHSQANIVVPVDTFTSGYMIREDYAEPNYMEISNRWFVPHVGIVRYDFESHCTVCSNPVYYSWKLLSYTVK
jgi:hypothetical protein